MQRRNLIPNSSQRCPPQLLGCPGQVSLGSYRRWFQGDMLVGSTRVRLFAKILLLSGPYIIWSLVTRGRVIENLLGEIHCVQLAVLSRVVDTKCSKHFGFDSSLKLI